MGKALRQDVATQMLNQSRRALRQDVASQMPNRSQRPLRQDVATQMLNQILIGVACLLTTPYLRRGMRIRTRDKHGTTSHQHNEAPPVKQMMISRFWCLLTP